MRQIALLLLVISAAHASVTVTRTSNDELHPSEMEIEVNLPYSDKAIHIPLTKTEAFENVPMTVVENGVSRTFSASQVHHPSHSHYRDIESKSVISVRHVNGKRQISGHVMHDGTSYFLEPVGDSGHRVSKNLIKEDPIAKQIDKKKLLKLQSRRKRQSLSSKTKENVVEIHLLLDHTVYNAFLSIYSTDSAALTEIHYYYTHILNGLDTAFRNIQEFSIGVSCIAFTIAKTQADATWLPTPGGPDDVTQAAIILGTMRKFAVGNVADHVMAFTRTDIKSGTNSNVCGMAFTSGVCKDTKESINEDQGLHSWGTAAHELAHNLGSEHDADGNLCDVTKKNLMSPQAGSYNLSDIANSYRFSSCSIANMKTYVDGLGSANCMKSAQGTQVASLTVSAREGARQTLSQVCKLSYPSSMGKLFVNRDTAVQPALICAKIYCVPGTDINQGSTTGGLRAPVGTPCGSQKSCNWNGECTADAAAPPADESCFFDDLWGNDCPGWAGYIDQLKGVKVADAKEQCTTNELSIFCCKSIGTRCNL